VIRELGLKRRETVWSLSVMLEKKKIGIRRQYERTE